MNQTKTLFLENTYLFAILAKVLQIGTDEIGHYFLVDRTIFYPQGGGQPADKGYFSFNQGQDIEIVSAKYTDTGIKHYTEVLLPMKVFNTDIAMRIIQDSRIENAAYHTAGHWLSQLVLENLRLPLFPVKGHHFPNEAYIEFDGDTTCITPSTIDELRLAMQIDLQANLKVIVEVAELGSKHFDNALLPKNFIIPANKPLRFTQIEGYRWLPCGGTHVEALREIKAVTPIEFYMKGKKLRLRYACQTYNKVV